MFNRKQTGKSDWDDAKAVVAEWEKAGSWNGQVTIADPLPATITPRRVTVEHAVATFLAELHEAIALSTHKKYRLLLTKFKEFSTTRGYVMIDQWEPSDVREFRTSWAVNPQTGARRMAMLKPFLEYCVSNKWITRNPARLVKNPRGRDAGEKRAEQKLPFTDEELKRMYDACPKYGSPKHKWTGDDVADFISLSIYTGLRISDVALFQSDRMNASGAIRVRTTKAGTHVYTWVPQWLQDRIRARAKIYGSFIFGSHTTKDLSTSSPRDGAGSCKRYGNCAASGKKSRRRIDFAIRLPAFFCKSRASPCAMWRNCWVTPRPSCCGITVRGS